MKMKLLSAAVLAALSFGAQAVTIDWGAHDAVEFEAFNPSAGSFSDIITFTIPGLTDLASVTVSNNIGAALNIVDGVVSLYSGSVGSGTLVDSYDFDGSTGSTSHAWTALAGGSYYYEVSGLANGFAGGLYTISSTVAAVPEPETYALMLAGLAAVGGIARRRRAR